jgi:SAM-dependent methyltransferase
MNHEAPLVRMREFYNRFPYPGRPLFLFPKWRELWLSHAGFAVLCCKRPAVALELWRRARGVWRPGVADAGAAELEQKEEPFCKVEREWAGDKRILLVGCGTDEPLLFRLLHRRNPLVGIDLSRRSLARARARFRLYRIAHPGVALEPMAFREGDAVALLSGGTLGDFHFIQCFGVLHHQPDARPLLEAMGRSLVPGGVLRLMIYAHHGRRLERRLQRRFVSRDEAEKRSVLQSWRLWVWHLGGFIGLHRRLFRRFGYLGLSRRAVADALLHPSDPGLPLEHLLALCAEVGLTCRFCEAKIWKEGWVAAAGECSAFLTGLVAADRRCDIVSNIVLVLQKNGDSHGGN